MTYTKLKKRGDNIMKRLALLLGSLLVVSAAASAKEVVPAPVVVEETPVQIVEKEVIVYRDREPEWRPSGYVRLQQEYYGRTEGQKITTTEKSSAWNENNEYMRTQAEAKVALTPNSTMDFRTRLYQGTHVRDKYAKNKSDQFRARYFYDHGTLGDSKVDMLSRLKYQKDGSGRGKQTVEYVLEFDFAKYMFNNDYVKTTKFAVGPMVARTWSDSMDKGITPERKVAGVEGHYGYVNSVGLYFDWATELPFGFGTELEIDSLAYSKGNVRGTLVDAEIRDGEPYKKAEKSRVTLPVKFLITHDYNLWADDAFSLDWHAEGGYDTYNFSNRKSFDHDKTGVSSKSYTLKFEPNVTLTYKANNFVSLYGTLGAEYSNWIKTNQKDASNWRWQPYAKVGVQTTF